MKLNKLIAIFAFLTIGPFNSVAFSKGLSIEDVYNKEGLKVTEDLLMTDTVKTKKFKQKLEKCNASSVEVALKIYAETVNASILPGLDEYLHNALMVCPEKILEGIDYSQIPAVCGAYSGYVENVVIRNKKKISNHYLKVTESLKRVKKPELSERASLCIKSLHIAD